MKYCQCNDYKLPERRLHTFTEKLHGDYRMYLTEYRLFVINAHSFLR